MDRKLIGLVAIFFLVFGLFTAMMVFEKPLTKFTKAKEETVVSAEKSIMFVWPLSQLADGKSESTINVFVRNQDGITIANKKVSLNSTLGEIKEIESVSDKQGKTEFKITSLTEGIAQLQATIENSIIISQKVSVKFTK